MPRKRKENVRRGKKLQSSLASRAHAFPEHTVSPMEQLETIRENPKAFIRAILGDPAKTVGPDLSGHIISAPRLQANVLNKEHEDRARIIGECIRRLNLEPKVKEELKQTEIRRLLLQKMIVLKHTKNSFSSDSLRLIALRIRQLMPTVVESLRSHPNAQYRQDALTTLENIEPLLEKCLQLRSGTVSLQNESYERLYDAGTIAFSVHQNLLLKNPFLVQEFRQIIDELQKAYYAWAVHSR